LCHAFIHPGTLEMISPTPTLPTPGASILIGNTAGSQVLQFNVSADYNLNATSLAQHNVSFGFMSASRVNLTSAMKPFRCASIESLPGSNPLFPYRNSTVRCTLGPAVGTDLSFFYYRGYDYFSRGWNDTFTYPAPEIFPLTIRTPSTRKSQYEGFFNARNTLPQSIVFEGLSSCYALGISLFTFCFILY
jgi:hypothetical protein